MNKTIRNSLILGLLALSLVGCATSSGSITKSGIEGNSALLATASKEVAKKKDSCKAETTTPGWFTGFIGMGRTVTTTIACE